MTVPLISDWLTTWNVYYVALVVLAYIFFPHCIELLRTVLALFLVVILLYIHQSLRSKKRSKRCGSSGCPSNFAQSMGSSRPLLDEIERLTQRKVGIEFGGYEAQGKFDEQEASPLFSKLPRELRDLIWEFATAPFEDETEEFETTAYYYRPGHTARLKTDIAVLQTCRRAFLEANTLPMLQAEHSYYYHRAAPDGRDPAWMAKLTEHNRRNFGHLRLFAQMYTIEGLNANTGCLRDKFLKTPVVPGDFQPRMLHVTIRHTDWWNWESEQPLYLQDGWVRALLNSPDLRNTQTLKLELETLDYKIDQLNPILERIKSFESEEKETHLINGKPAKTVFVLTGEPTIHNWEGPANIHDREYEPYAGMNTLKYHVVTLTWKLRFPEIPNAFVPELRRAPRIEPVPSSDTEANSYDDEDEWDGDFNDMFDERPTTPVPLIQRAKPPVHTSKKSQTIGKRENEEWRQDRAQYRYIRLVSREVQLESQRQADMFEMARRRQFEDWSVEGLVKRWETRWQAEGALLQFADRVSQSSDE